MKRRSFVLAVALLIFSLLGTSAAEARRLDGFLGIPWGAAPATVTSVMNQRPDTRQTRSVLGTLSFRGPFSGDLCSITFAFSDSKLVRATVEYPWPIPYSRDPIGGAQAKFWETASLLTEKYGSPDELGEDDPEPTGYHYKATVGGVWNFEDGHFIACTLNPELRLSLIYSTGFWEQDQQALKKSDL